MFMQTTLAALGPAAAAVIFATASHLPMPFAATEPEVPVVHAAVASGGNGYDPAYVALSDLSVYDDLGHGAAAEGPGNCQPHAGMSQMLQTDFHEAPQLAAQTETGLGMELWASDQMGTWTALHRGSDGISCVVASGIGWAPGVGAQALLDRAVTVTPGAVETALY